MAFWERLKEIDDPSSYVVKSADGDDGFETIQNMSSQIHEERIKNAPKIVQDYYNGTGIKFEKGLFRVLVAKKSNRFIFLVMIIMIAVVFITGNLTGRDNLKVVNGYECELQSFSYDDKLYASVKIHPVLKTKQKLQKEIEKQGPMSKSALLGYSVQIDFYGLSESGVQMLIGSVKQTDPQDLDKYVLLDPVIYRVSSDDYNVEKVIAYISIGNKSDELSVKVVQKIQ